MPSGKAPSRIHELWKSFMTSSRLRWIGIDTLVRSNSRQGGRLSTRLRLTGSAGVVESGSLTLLGPKLFGLMLDKSLEQGARLPHGPVSRGGSALLE